MIRVSDGDRSTLLSFLSCGASQEYAPQSDEVISILRVLFRSVGVSTFIVVRPSTMSPSTCSSSSGRASCHVSRQDTSRGVPSQGRHEDRQESRVPATDRRPGSRVELGQRGLPLSRGQCVCSCVTLPSQDQPHVRRDEEVLDARGGLHLRVGAAQEEQGWRRRAL